ncbi:MAG TPA: hypothetical protein VFP12_03990 [Allosphingosinicella sp.]|nr:hypothetical protein [Allosphingosinicella sp.]
MSFTDVRGPMGPFVMAVGGAALTAAAMLSAFAWLDEMDIALVVAPFLFGVALIGAMLVIAPAAALIGLPLTWLLARTRSEQPWTYPAAGLVAGGLILIGLYRLDNPVDWRPAPETLVPVASFGAVPGFVCGALWWLLYRRHLQDGSSGE